MKKILITGGAGFIGSHLSEKLVSNGYDVTILDNFATGKLSNLNNIINKSNLNVIEADIRNFSKIIDFFTNVDIVFHLAALAEIVPSIENPKDYFDTNVNGTFNIIEASKKNNISKIIYAASSSCYGLPNKYPTPENHPTNPMYPYALTKYIGEQLLIHWSKVYNIPSISLRLFNVYGPKSRTSGTYGAVFGVFLAQKIAKMPFTIVGNGEQTRDFTYVDDVIDSMISAAFSSIDYEIFNVGSSNSYSINKLVDLIGGEKVYIPKRPGEPECTWADISKIKNILGWQPNITFENGVSKILENIDYWRDAPVWDEEKIKLATKEWFRYLK
ncbi:SDR family oxidoreductase [Alphaproteobacteria bacterium]|nr:SDR family oxidoreductase [Alphaproteobacteria bacterium]